MFEDKVERRTESLARSVWPAVFLFGVVVTAWVVAVERMRGMDAGPGTDLGRLSWYLGIWVTMSAAMMLPSAAPTALLVARIARGLPTLLFTAGYLAAWTAYGLVAYALFRLVGSLELGWLAWDRGGPFLAGGAIVAAGLYELTPLKERCLRRCRDQRVRMGGLATGLEHGLYCVGCCFGLMAVLFALGAMSLLWMAVVAGVIFVEKVLPYGVGLSRLVALALVALGIWVAVSPASVPGLTEPERSTPMQMEMK